MNGFTKNHGILFHFARVISRNLSRNAKLKELLLKMPKEATHVPVLKEGRKLKKETLAKYPAGIVNLQVLGSGAKGAPRSLYVFTDQNRYLFNCGEGTQRLAHEHKMKLARLEHVFITQKVWDNTGGLPGLALTIQDIGVPEITLHGPPGLEKLFAGTKRFVVMKDLKIKVAKMSSSFADHILQVDYVKLFPTEQGGSLDKLSGSEESVIEEDETDYYAPIKGCKRNLEVTNEDKQSKRAKVENTGSSGEDDSTEREPENPDTVVCYVCRPKMKEGTLLIEKCVERGVPPGPLLGKLKAGEDVTLPNGTIVKSEDVRSPHCPGPVFIVVDCPDERYMDSLLNNPDLKKYQKPENPADFPHVVVHFTPSNIMMNPPYKEWMENFGDSTKHMLLNDTCFGLGSEAVHRLQHKLHLIDKDMFPLLNEDGVEFYSPVTSAESATNSGTDELKINQLEVTKPPNNLNNIQVPFIRGTTLLKYMLRPTPGLDDSYSALIIDHQENVREVLENEEFAPVLESFKSRWSGLVQEKDIYPEILFLGTGSSIPNKTRNTSAILMNIDSNSSIMMDCGEGTFGQLVRFFGASGVDEILAKLKVIYISHLHADHHMGLIQLLRKRLDALRNLNQPPSPIFLLAPHQIQTWLHLYSNTFENIKNAYTLVANVELRQNLEVAHDSVSVTELKHLTGFSDIKTEYMRHCPNAFGVAFTHSAGWKVTYSGDTMPCNGLVEIGQDSDVLIHEATMEDSLKQEAVLKQHSTTSEAIEIGNRMNAKAIILTHFSQRYAKVPVISDKFANNVGIAFDNMKIRKCDLVKIPFMYDVLKTVFTADVEYMEDRTQKRMKRKEVLGMNTAQVSEIAG